MKKIGKAYGFFDCRASKEAIVSELPTIRRLGNVPSRLELSLNEGFDSLKRCNDNELVSLAKEAEENGIKYVLEATHPDATNEEAADELKMTFMNMYGSSLYEKKEDFRGEIVYKGRDGYVFRD